MYWPKSMKERMDYIYNNIDSICDSILNMSIDELNMWSKEDLSQVYYTANKKIQEAKIENRNDIHTLPVYRANTKLMYYFQDGKNSNMGYGWSCIVDYYIDMHIEHKENKYTIDNLYSHFGSGWKSEVCRHFPASFHC